MKYIDAATAAETISDKLNIPLNDLCDIVAEIPSEDVQPVKHERWIYQGYNTWLCSYCKENLIYSETEIDRAEKQRYCSRCGARMDGDSE